MKELSTFQTDEKGSKETSYQEMNNYYSLSKTEKGQTKEIAYAEMPIEEANQIEIDTCPDDHISIDDLLKFSCKNQCPKEYYNYKKCDSRFSNALSDHNYTSQEVIDQPKLKMVRDLLLNVVEPNSSTEIDIPKHFWNFLKNTINVLNLYKIVYKDNKNIHLNQFQKISTTDSSQNRNTEGIREKFSEPLELNLNDNYFINEYKDFENQNALSPLLKSTMHFAKQLYYESMSLPLKTEDELKNFISEKITKLQEIAIGGCVVKNKSTDVKSKHSMNRYQTNIDPNMNLLSTTSGSSDTDIDFESSCDQLKIESSCGKSMVLCVESHRSLSTKIRNIHEHFYDNIDLCSYIKLDIISKTPSKIFDDHCKHKYSCLTDNDTDKEIERLINLNVLSKRKRQKTQIQPKNKIFDKSLERSEVKSVPALEDELDTNESEPIFDMEKNTITEDEFISRYNEEIKLQLLKDSNSDSGLSNKSNYGNSKDSASDVDDFMTNIVDKFLHAFESDKNLSGSVQNNKNFNAFKAEVSFNSDSFINRGSLKTSKIYSCSELNPSIILSSESDDSDIEHKVKQSRFIKPMLRIDQLAIETRAAQKNESERIRRLEKKNSELSKALKTRTSIINKNDLILDYIEITKTFVAVDEDIVKQLKPHQKDGVKFMYDSCYGGTDQNNKNSGSGCILAHCMGLGKTLQLITLLHTVISYEELNTYKIMVLCPKSTVMNWADEFHRWLSPLKSNKNIKVFIFPDASDISEKLRVLKEWSLSSKEKAGCLLLGYEAFRALVFYHSYKYKGSGTTSKSENIRDKVKKYLLQPGADIVVCDEGHIIKNSKSAISLAVAKIKTPKRIILTGTPIQNNLKEW
ncbi:transcriptional regulator ATRX-like isoform X2 [Drosophila serrata]|uniref:transcriptional regulator ATRX-like isoform X2 n=1 Tax=Drosophila serrata TaxID=7274 RepID=UPI000A1D1343|nr:transcriptional regulator ATRX-like isoform X2 [Drosophila serrata]